MILFHPATAALMLCVPIVAMSIAFTEMFDKGEDYQIYRDQIEVTDSEIAFGDNKSGETVAVLGTIRNMTSIPWEEIHFHADFFDAAGKRVDVGHKHEFFYYLPPDATSSFKVSFQREFPATNYANHNVRVVGAKDARTRW